MEAHSVFSAGGLLTELVHSPASTNTILRNILRTLPEPLSYAAVETADGLRELLILAPGALFAIAIEVASENTPDIVDGRVVRTSRVPLDPEHSRVTVTEHHEAQATTTVVRQWTFELGGRGPLSFTTRELVRQPDSIAERLARRLAAELVAWDAAFGLGGGEGHDRTRREERVEPCRGRRYPRTSKRPVMGRFRDTAQRSPRSWTPPRPGGDWGLTGDADSPTAS
jgi:hypothetical protein